MVNGGFPPGFVPQSITDARGRSIPVNGGNGFIPPLGGERVGGGGWSASSRRFGGDAGSTPGPRSQDLPPFIIPDSAMGGGWSTPSHPPVGFDGRVMTPGPRNQDLPPVIPNPTVSWSAPSPPPSGFGGGGMTPGPRSRDLPPVIPNLTVDGEWSSLWDGLFKSGF